MSDQDLRTTNEVQSRNEKFAEKVSTKICHEVPSSDNPYIASKCFYYGYNLIELIQKTSYPEVVFLLFRGELPSPEQSRLFERLMVSLCNPGPRHHATRAAMVASISKTKIEHLLPISLSILGGKYLGAGEVEDSMNFIRKHRIKNPVKVARTLLDKIGAIEKPDRIAPGFGSEFKSVNIIIEQIAELLVNSSTLECKALNWGLKFAEEIRPHGYGWLAPGLAAASFMDLGFSAQEGPGLYQLLSAPGLLAHGVEMSRKPITDMPFVPKEKYFIENND